MRGARTEINVPALFVIKKAMIWLTEGSGVSVKNISENKILTFSQKK